jgi:hypothetical protein
LKEQRGFDIDGHHYWYRHPWMISDIIFLLQHGAPPHERALSYSEKMASGISGRITR